MTGEITRRIVSSPVERAHGRALQSIDHATDEALDGVRAVADVTRGALFSALSMEMTKREAELMCPDGAAAFHLITSAGMFNLAQLVQRFDGQPS